MSSSSLGNSQPSRTLPIIATSSILIAPSDSVLATLMPSSSCSTMHSTTLLPSTCLPQLHPRAPHSKDLLRSHVKMSKPMPLFVSAGTEDGATLMPAHTDTSAANVRDTTKRKIVDVEPERINTKGCSEEKWKWPKWMCGFLWRMSRLETLLLHTLSFSESSHPSMLMHSSVFSSHTQTLCSFVQSAKDSAKDSGHTRPLILTPLAPLTTWRRI
jgi:hypothetical protein